MNFKSTQLDDRLNALLIAVALTMALFGDADALFDWAGAGDVAVAVAATSAMVPAALV